jgi:hypothetical protein
MSDIKLFKISEAQVHELSGDALQVERYRLIQMVSTRYLRLPIQNQYYKLRRIA